MSDRQALADLVHRYADGVTRQDLEQWSSCWAEDARWWVGPNRTASGREAIVALLEDLLGRLEGVVQNVLNGVVSIDHGTARGQWYIIEHYRRVSGEAALVLGRYDDTYTYAGRDGGWLFASRTLVTSYHGPPDLSVSFTT